MRGVVLIENSAGHPGCVCEHGLSVYFETETRRVLADTGSTAAFLENAEALGVDLARTDLVFLSHGHYDHAGGIPEFAARYPRVPIYLRKSAGGDYYAMDPDGPRYVGMEKSVLALPQAIPLDCDRDLDGGVTCFGNVTERRLWSKSNLLLRRREGENYLQDSFDHEQALVLREREKYCLFTGCAHCGVLNFLDRFREKYGRCPDAVVGGFHFMKKGDYTPEEETVIRKTAKELSVMPTVFYSGHCTGRRAWAMMAEIMGDGLREIHTGTEFTV